MVRSAQRNAWYLVSAHGSVLFFIAVNPLCTVNDIARGLHLTHRTIWGVVGDLRRAGMLSVHRRGRVHHYSVNLDAPFTHKAIPGLTLRVILGRLVEEASRRPSTVP